MLRVARGWTCVIMGGFHLAAGPSHALSSFRAHEQLSRALLGFISMLMPWLPSWQQDHPGLGGAERMGGVLSPPSWLKQQRWLQC